MILFPAIDLKDGSCVRLLRGNMHDSITYNRNPAAQAAQFSEMGCEWLHVVDLDGAFTGRSINGPAVDSILSRIKTPIQLGGGIRNIESVEYWLERGVSRIILGTAALKNPDLVREACRLFPGQIAVGIDARDGRAAINGWQETSESTVLELARRFEDCGVIAIIFTDINRDGALQGLNINATCRLAEQISTPIIASGGVASISDLEALLPCEPKGVTGVICGKAIYDKRLDLLEAMKFLSSNNE